MPLATMYPGMAPMEGFDAGVAQRQMVDNANRNNSINQAGDLQKMYFDQQMQPLNMQKAQADIGHTQALTGQAEATTKRTNQDYDFNELTKDARYQKFRDDAASAHTKAELEQELGNIERDLMSQDPKIRQQAGLRYAMTSDVLKERLKLDQMGQNAKDVANINGSWAVKAAQERSAGRVGAGAKTPKTPKELYTFYSIQAQNAEDPAEAQKFAALADQAWKKVMEEANAKQPGYIIGPDGRAMANPVVGAASPTEVIKPGQAPTAPPAKAPPSQADLEYTAKKYNMTVDQVKAKLGIK